MENKKNKLLKSKEYLNKIQNLKNNKKLKSVKNIEVNKDKNEKDKKFYLKTHNMKATKSKQIFKYKSTKDQLAYFEIIPHSNTRNYNNSDLSRAINGCHTSFLKQFKTEDGTLCFEEKTKVSYYIYISKDEGVKFYLIVPKVYSNIFLEKVASVWNKVEVKEVNEIPRFDKKAYKASMEYSREDSLSLDLIDKKSNELLDSQLNVLTMMKPGDRMGIFYNFTYQTSYNQVGFKTKYSQCMDKIRDGKSVDKVDFSTKSIACGLARGLVSIGEDLMEGVTTILGEQPVVAKDLEAFKSSVGIVQKKELSKHTKDKSQLEVIGTQILLLSESESDKFTAKNNLSSLSQAFGKLDGDNSLRPKNVWRNKNIDFDAKELPIGKSIMSTEEVGRLFTQAGKDVINKYKIDANSINEEEVPESCKKGYICVGTAMKNGVKQEAYLNDDPDLDTGLAIVGKQGSGKTEFLKNYAYYCMKRGDSLIVIDYIANNDLASTIEQIVPKNKLIVLDLADVDRLQALAYNELYYEDNASPVEKLDKIGAKTQYSAELINSISVGQDLTNAMRRYFVSASNVTYAVNQFASFKDIIDCLELYDVRMNFISRIPKDLREMLEDDVNTILKLNEKYTKGDMKGEDTGETCEGKIDRILDRISVMRESMRTKYMFNKSPENNISFEESIKEGKIILIKMKQDLFGAKHIKNMLALFFTTKTWISCMNIKSNSKKGEELRRVHLLIDEPHQVPGVTEYLNGVFPQMRKFRLKPVFATQSLLQLSSIQDDMKSAGFSYMLLAGADKVNYNLLKEELLPYEVEDLLSLERLHSLNLIPNENSVLTPFVTKLPPRLITHNENEQ